MKEDKEYLAEILPKLKELILYKWRVQSFNKNKPQATCVAYIDARDAQDRLDQVCVYGWERDHREIKSHVYAGVGIVMPSGRILWRWDCGAESNQDAEKGEASDSFKRAAVNWGVGRFLYDLKIKYVDANEKKTNNCWPYVVDGNKRVWDLTEFINNKNKGGGKAPNPESEKDDTLKAFIAKVEEGKKVIGEDNYKKALNEYNVDSADKIPSNLRQNFITFMRTFKEDK